MLVVVALLIAEPETGPGVDDPSRLVRGQPLRPRIAMSCSRSSSGLTRSRATKPLGRANARAEAVA